MAVMGAKASAKGFRERGARSAAYTLIELVIVLLVVGILAATAAPKYSESLASFRLQAVAHRIAGDIGHARRTAQQNSSMQTISFDVDTNSYTLSGVTSIDRRSQGYQFSLGQTEYSCQLVSANFNGSPVLTFDVYGRPQSAGSIVVQYGGATRNITVNDVGQVSSP
jgi:prepilin-type N-terminal cleavage/methylation domain-containing protein